MHLTNNNEEHIMLIEIREYKAKVNLGGFICDATVLAFCEERRPLRSICRRRYHRNLLRLFRLIHPTTKETIMSTNVEVNGEVVAVRFWGGTARGCVVEMQVTKTEWEQVKFAQASRDDQGPMVASAEMVVQSMCEDSNVERTWKTPAQFNADAREAEQHRFAASMPEFFGHVAQASRERAKEAAREQMSVV